GGGALLEDLGAKNGVALNGVRIVGRRTLRAGDTIGIGETILALELPGGAPRPRAEGRPRPRRRPGPLAAAALLALAAAALAHAGS
ncbi:MAG TPA: FHA domain-containing protein, partial [Anaeromyxobacter sp.]|nr:FHA domain-containing protein [Anaeromyxobacter sp.]